MLKCSRIISSKNIKRCYKYVQCYCLCKTLRALDCLTTNMILACRELFKDQTIMCFWNSIRAAFRSASYSRVFGPGPLFLFALDIRYRDLGQHVRYQFALQNASLDTDKAIV